MSSGPSYPDVWRPKKKVRYADGPLRGEIVETNAQRLYVELKTWKVRVAVYDLVFVDEKDIGRTPYFHFLGWIDDPTIDVFLKKHKPSERLALQSGRESHE